MEPQRSTPRASLAATQPPASQRLLAEYLAQLRTTIDALGRAEPQVLTDEVLDEFVTLYGRWQAEDE
jgi:hypothetical protein